MNSISACMFLASSLAASASAQSASLAVTSSSTTVAPGGSVTVSLVATIDTAGAASGLFGDAGLFGFSGEAVISGSASTGAAVSIPGLNSELTFGPVTEIQPDSNAILRAAGGRGSSSGLAGPTITLATFNLSVDNAASGTITVGYDGDVILALGDNLESYDTNPGAGQDLLAVTPVTITVSNGQPCGDQNGDGNFTGADFNAFLTNFVDGNSLADVNGDGNLTGADFNAWLTAFSLGAAGPLCS